MLNILKNKLLVTGILLTFSSFSYSQATVIPDTLVFSNYFSPNGDGHNDTFVILNLETYEECLLMVYNIWGDLVYENNAYANNWNGKANRGLKITGKDLPEGVYYYVFEDSLGNKYKGQVTLKR